jgi:RNA polymerase sigma-70 factor (sigma-E family)
MVSHMDERDEAEFTAFVAAQWSALHRAAFLMTGDHQLAEDLTQASFTKAYLSWPRISRMDHPAAYVRRTLFNQATSWWRRRSTSELPTDVIEREAEPGFEDTVAVSCVVWNAVLALPGRQRAVIVLHYYEHLSTPEIANLLEMAEGTVRSHLHAARRTLGANLVDTSAANSGGGLS